MVWNREVLVQQEAPHWFSFLLLKQSQHFPPNEGNNQAHNGRVGCSHSYPALLLPARPPQLFTATTW